ncbi:MAG: phosphatase PAP2 family protein [Erysipelotrichales bacterium]
MQEKAKTHFITGGILLLLFIVFTIVVKNIDVQPIGPQGSSIGLAGINEFFFNLFGEHPFWYKVTDILGKLSMLVAGLFGIFGIVQLIKRKSFFKVDKDIITLAIFYIVILNFYLLFEIVIINYRPVLLDGQLEASYPSSHTMIILCIMYSVLVQAKLRIKDTTKLSIVRIIVILIIVVTIIGRFISGVHWFSDILGGLILGLSLCYMYSGSVYFFEANK